MRVHGPFPIAGYVSETPVTCLPYINACGVGTYCSSGHFCVNGTCAVIAGLAPAATASPAGTIAAASLRALGGGGAGPLQACAAARAAQQGCSADASPLLRTDGTKLGYAMPTADTECFESAAFKCCAAPGHAGRGVDSLVSACKGVVLLENAVSGLVNGTASLISYVANAASNSSGPGGAGGAQGGFGAPQGGADGGGNATAAAAAVATAVLTRPVAALEPVFQGLANVVTNVSRALLGPLNKTANGTIGGGGQWGGVSYTSVPPKTLASTYSSGARAGTAPHGGLVTTAAVVGGHGGCWHEGRAAANTRT
jgi:hypothetical protein